MDGQRKVSCDSPFISVVIPTYNRAHCLREAIDSVLAQTFTDYEIIVTDDGSTDNTKDLLQAYLPKIRYIYQKNQGVAAARNAAIKDAKGQWIAFLDSDDEWLPSKLELQVKDLQQYPDAVLSCSNVLFEGPSGAQSIDFFKSCLSFDFNCSQFILEPFFKCYAFTSTVLAKRDTIVAVGMFNENLQIFEDGDLFFRISTQGGFVVNPIVLAKAVRRVERADLNLSIQFLKNKERFYENVITACNEYGKIFLTPMQKKHVQEKISSSWFDLGMVHHDLKNTSLAKRCFFESFQAHPSWKNFVKFLLGLSGTIGINYIKKGRETKKGFRRSEYYQNDSKQ